MCETSTKLLSSKEVARVLGVSESSVKRWIDDGALKAEKTPGGHRRVAINDLDAFIRSTGRPVADMTLLGIDTDLDVHNFAKVYQRYSAALRIGDSFTMHAIVRRLMLDGEAFESIVDRLTYPAFLEIRSECHHPSEECLILHRAIEITRSVLSARVPRLEAQDFAKRPVFLFADKGYEVDGLPCFLAELVVADLVTTIQLGVDVPNDVICGAIDHGQCHGIFLSASGPVKNRKLLAADCEEIFKYAQRKNLPCYIFGDFFKGKTFHRYQNVQVSHNFSTIRGAIKNFS